MEPDFFTKYILNTLSDPVTSFFATTLFTLFTLSFFSVIRKGGNISMFHQYMPNALPMLGVIGTFVGIYIGLIDFDVKNVDGSIEKLLSGLKVAFSSSIIGLTLSLILRLMYSWRTSKQIEATPENQIQMLLKGLSKITKDGDDKHNEILSKIAFSISGETESSVVGQLKGLRDENHDDYKSLRRSLDEGFNSNKNELRAFSQKMSEDSSAVLVQALSELINDFNETLTSQFGENFKQLNEAVGELVVWQDNYKKYVEKLSEQFDNNKECLVEIENSFEGVSENTQNISVVMEKLGGVVELADERVSLLSSHLDQLSNIHKQAGSTLPIIEKKVIELTDGLTSSVLESTRLANESVEEQQKAMIEFLSSFRSAYENGINQTSDVLGESFKKFDADMQSEIERTIEFMGSHLTALSQKLVEDYEPLVNELRQLITLSRKVNS